MKEYMVAYLIEPLHKGAEFTAWPLHLTIIPWFSGTDNGAVKAIKTVVRQTQPFTVKAGGKDFFGPKKDKPVRLMQHSSGLYELHNDLLDGLSEHGFVLASASYTGKDYRPHVTDKHNSGLETGMRLLIDRVELIEAHESQPRQGRIKRLIESFELGN